MTKVGFYIPIAEVARRTGLSRPTIYKLIEDGIITTDEHGNIKTHEFEELLKREER